MELIVKPNKYYLYHHINPENNKVFYVGVEKHSIILETSKTHKGYSF